MVSRLAHSLAPLTPFPFRRISPHDILTLSLLYPLPPIRLRFVSGLSRILPLSSMLLVTVYRLFSPVQHFLARREK